MGNEITPITTHDVESRIITVRGQQVILDCDVADLYGVETCIINQAVKNNSEKFPSRCIIQLTQAEVDILKIKNMAEDDFAVKNFDRKKKHQQ